jgi:hypothetical protein
MTGAFAKKNQKKLRKINDQLLKEVVVEFSKMLYELAIISYVLSKIASKPRFLAKEHEPQMQRISEALKVVSDCIDACPEKQMKEKFDAVYDAIKELEKGDARFLIDLVSKGKLKVAAIIYAQGISLGIASEMTGMDKHEILNYAGKTMMFDRLKGEKDIKERMKSARKLIGKSK